MLDINIILLNYRGAARTIALVDQLLGVTEPDFHIVLVDNNSQDGSAQQFQAHYHQHPSVTLLNNATNAGFAAGCQYGINWAQQNSPAQYTLLLNNDTRIRPDTIKQLWQHAKKTQAGVTGAQIRQTTPPYTVQALGGGFIHHWLGTARHHPDKKPPDYITGACMLIDNRIFQTGTAFDIGCYFMYWEDADFCQRIRQQGFSQSVAEQAILEHEETVTLGKANPLFAYYFNQSATRYFLRHHRWPLIPIVIGVTGRSVKQLLRRNPRAAWACLQGMYNGYQNHRRLIGKDT